MALGEIVDKFVKLSLDCEHWNESDEFNMYTTQHKFKLSE